LNIHFKEKVNIADVRTIIKNITVTDDKTNAPTPKYPDAEVLSVMPPVTDTGVGGLKSMFSKAGQMSEEFQIRTRYVRTEKGVSELKKDLLSTFSDKVAHETITLITSTNKAGYKLMMELNTEKPVSFSDLKGRLAELAKRNKKQDPLVIIPEASEEISNTMSAHFEIYFREDEPVQWERAVRAKEGLDLPRGVFPVAGMIDTMVSKSLQQNAVIAIILSWICMLIYVAFRFELKYGLAAVVALIHDVLFALGATAAFNLIVPDSWGISVEINFTSVAALMTIIGYSVNDTIVIFDRVRENMQEMKRQPLEAILNASVNQTLGRTIITSLTVFFTVTILFLVTATSGAGIVSFAFPMVVGTVAGSYSTIFIAAPFVKAWGGGGENKPQGEKKD
jgi:preprotein translocase SecF subunit